MSPPASTIKLSDIALPTARPYTSKIVLNGSFRHQSKPVSTQVQQAFSMMNVHDAVGVQRDYLTPPRDGKTGAKSKRKNKSDSKDREKELLTGIGSQFD